MIDKQYIIIYQDQYDGFMRTRTLFNTYLSNNRIDVIPVEIKPDDQNRGRWILPAILLIDPLFKPIANHLNSLKALDNLEIRHVDDSEFIETDPEMQMAAIAAPMEGDFSDQSFETNIFVAAFRAIKNAIVNIFTPN